MSYITAILEALGVGGGASAAGAGAAGAGGAAAGAGAGAALAPAATAAAGPGMLSTVANGLGTAINAVKNIPTGAGNLGASLGAKVGGLGGFEGAVTGSRIGGAIGKGVADIGGQMLSSGSAGGGSSPLPPLPPRPALPPITTGFAPLQAQQQNAQPLASRYSFGLDRDRYITGRPLIGVA